MTKGFISLLLATIHILLVSSATVDDIRLIGDSDSYINVQSARQHILRCTFRAGYDDPVSTVRWFKDNQLVYSWREGANEATAYRPLSGFVSTSEVPELQHLYFNKYSLDLSGNYKCQVNSALGIANSNSFQLVILDVPNDDFVTNVTLLEAASSGTDSRNCTLLWDFKTPAIFPKPNVTCGYYSYLHDDVVDSLPAGLTMHLLYNGSWEAGFYKTQVQVADIPRKERLGCTVSVPHTSYKKVIKFEDSFVIDHLIDSEGCPTLLLDPLHGFQVTSEGGEVNCRGDTIPTSNEVPSKINFRCSGINEAMFSDGNVVPNWSLELICDPELKTWHLLEGEVPTTVTNLTDVLPMCVAVINNVGTMSSAGIPLSFVLSVVIFYVFKLNL